MSEQEKLSPLSASKIKVLKSCSFLFFCKYFLRLPDKQNTGSAMGTGVHAVAECLLKPRHKKLFDEIFSSQSVQKCKVVSRYFKSYIKKTPILSDEHFDKMCEMLLVGLNTDFFCKGSTKIDPELAFDITNESPRYRILGYIDKIAHYAGNFIRIVDYKTSKNKYAGKELSENVQAMSYSLAAKHQLKNCKPVVDFLFLQYPDGPQQRIRFTDEQLSGFEYYLANVQKQIDNFTKEDAVKNFAADQPYPAPEDGFSGPLMCGRAKKPGQLKKDGTPMYACQFKFPFGYWALCNENGDVIKSSFENDLKPNEEKGEFVIKKRFSGCPRWNKH